MAEKYIRAKCINILVIANKKNPNDSQKMKTFNDKCIGSVEIIDYQQYLENGPISKKINAVVLMHLQGESSIVMSRSLRSISKYNIKVIAASKEEIQEYASEAQALEYERKIKIMGVDSPKDIIQYIKETYENLVNLALANFDIYDEDRSGTL